MGWEECWSDSVLLGGSCGWLSVQQRRISGREGVMTVVTSTTRTEEGEGMGKAPATRGGVVWEI